ncbi:MAG TPA: hypothetical protein VGF73_07910 [Chthoniobacterales bacterium]|jgi:N-acetylmuramoyl-L-alanine amidase
MFRYRLTRGLALLLLLSPPLVHAADEETPNEPAVKLSTLGRKPDWSELERFQGTMTQDEFAHLLNGIYCPKGFDPDLIEVQPEAARILSENGSKIYFTLRFATSDTEKLPTTHTWTAPSALSVTDPTKPLTGFNIALDPGHLGGRWAKMEERWFKIGDAPPVMEGDMTLKVAQLLAPRLESLGAKVTLIRVKTEPITPYRPSDFTEIARQFLKRTGVAQPREDFNGPSDPEKEKSVSWQRELLFYRNSEIRRRASLVNYRLQPDLVLCLHFNAEPWGDPNHPSLSENNHLHLLVNGCYLPAEVALDDERFEMMRKLLSRAYPEELEMAETLASTMAKATGLPPYHYKTENVTPVGTSGYVYARNLMATRLYHCPTIYLEPYVMNSRTVFVRAKAGDYEGMRKVAGKMRPSIYREYADSVVAGLLAYFKKVRP